MERTKIARFRSDAYFAADWKNDNGKVYLSITHEMKYKDGLSVSTIHIPIGKVPVFIQALKKTLKEA